MQKEEYKLNAWGYFFALVGCAVGYLLSVLFRQIWPVVPLHCADGWSSLSIGIQGACSHHGGVVGGDTMPWFMGWVPPIIGFVTFGMFCKKFHAYTIVKIGRYGSSTIGKCADAIDKAIQLHQAIEFLYMKKGHTQASRRKVLPTKLFYMQKEIVSTLCASGYCYTRRADRTFLLARMSEVKPVKLA